jgi:hypothetical protein
LTDEPTELLLPPLAGCFSEDPESLTDALAFLVLPLPEVLMPRLLFLPFTCALGVNFDSSRELRLEELPAFLLTLPLSSVSMSTDMRLELDKGINEQGWCMLCCI